MVLEKEKKSIRGVTMPGRSLPPDNPAAVSRSECFQLKPLQTKRHRDLLVAPDRHMAKDSKSSSCA